MVTEYVASSRSKPLTERELRCKGVFKMFKNAMEIQNEVMNYSTTLNMETLRDHSNKTHTYMLCDMELKKMDNYSLSSVNETERHNREEEMRPLRQEIRNLQELNGLHLRMK